MSKVSDMAQAIEDLRSAAAAIADAANWPTHPFSGEDTTDLFPEVRAVLADKSCAGHTAAVRELLQKYSAAKLSQIDPKHYEALMKASEALDDAT